MAQYDIKISQNAGANKITIDRCRDFEVLSVTTFGKISLVNYSTPVVSDDAYVVEPREYVIGGYVTTANRVLLEARKETYAEVEIWEGVDDNPANDIKIDDGYIIDLKSEYAGQENWSYPWYVTITIISNVNA